MLWARRIAMVACVFDSSTPSTSSLGRATVWRSAGAGALGAAFERCAPCWTAVSTSSFVMRPPGPDPVTRLRSTPCSSARRRATGETRCRSPSCCSAGRRITFSAACAAAPTSVRSSGPPCGYCSPPPASGPASCFFALVAIAFSACATCASALVACGLGASAAGAFPFCSGSPASGCPFGAAGFSACDEASPSPPISAMTAPIGALSPSGTTILLSLPEAYASTSMLALSLSISTSGSPFLTSSPSFFSQRRILPVSIESDRRGIWTLAIGAGLLVLSEHGPGGYDHVGLAGEGNLLQPLVVGRWDFRGADSGDRGIEVVERFLIDAAGDLRAHAIGAPAFLDGDQPAGLLDRLDHGGHVERTQRPHIDHFGADAPLLELGGGVHGDDQHPRMRADGDVVAGSLDVVLVQRHQMLTVGHLALDGVGTFVLHEHHRIVVANRRLQHALGVGGSARGNVFQPGNVGIQVLIAVRVLGTQLMTAAPGRPDHQRDLRPAAKHVADVGRGVDHLVHRHHDEVDGHHLGHRAKPGHRGADGGPDNDFFGDRGVEHPLFPELLPQAARDLE